MRDDKVNRKALGAAEKAREKVKRKRKGLHDRRRVQHTLPATGEAKRAVSDDAGGTGKREKHCGNCAACWQSDVPVVFIEH